MMITNPFHGGRQSGPLPPEFPQAIAVANHGGIGEAAFDFAETLFGFGKAPGKARIYRRSPGQRDKQ